MISSSINNISELLGKSVFENEKAQMALSLDFIPGTGFKYLMAACDGGVKIFDFESEKVRFKWKA